LGILGAAMLSSNPAFRGALLALAAGTMFSFGGITVRLSPSLDSFQYILWRCVGLVPLILAINAWRGTSPLRQVAASGWLGLCGGLCLTAAGVLFIFAMKATTVANALLFASGAPLLGALLARLFLKEEIGAVTWIAIALGALGLVVMTGSELGAGNALGNLAAVGSAVAYALYSILARIGRGRDMAGAVTSYSLMTAGISLGIVLASGATLATPMAENVMAMVHGAIFIGGGMVLFNLAARLVRAGQLTLLAQTETVLGPLWVFLIFAETPRLATTIGGAVILAGVLLSAWGEARSPFAGSAALAGDLPDDGQKHDPPSDDRREARVLPEKHVNPDR
jgi:drug/metabolite transporter (DMT)-like permease